MQSGGGSLHFCISESCNRFTSLRTPCTAGTLLSTLCTLCPPLASALAAAAAAAPPGWSAAGPLLAVGVSGSGNGDDDAEAVAGALAGEACLGCVAVGRHVSF